MVCNASILVRDGPGFLSMSCTEILSAMKPQLRRTHKQFRATPMGTVMAFGKGSQSQEVRQNLATGLWKCANLLVLLLNQFFLNVYAISYFPDIEMIPRASTRVISP